MFNHAGRGVESSERASQEKRKTGKVGGERERECVCAMQKEWQTGVRRGREGEGEGRRMVG